MEVETSTRAISAIDRDINAVERELLRRHPKHKHQTAADWQHAWDQEPELRQRETALYRERGFAQLERAQREAATSLARVVRTPRQKKCPACKGIGRLAPTVVAKAAP